MYLPIYNWQNDPVKVKGEIQTLYNKCKIKEFVSAKPALQKILKGLLHIKKETRVIKMDLLVKVLVSKPDDSVPWEPLSGKREPTPTICSLTFT